MSELAGATVGLVGALSSLPRRLAAREVEARGGQLRRGVTRATSIVVFGRSLLARRGDAQIEAEVAALRAPGRSLRSENGFLRQLVGEAAPGTLRASALAAQSGLAAGDVEMIALFDGFEHDGGLFSFRDLILARKYAGLIAGGATWGAIVRSVHRFGPAESLTAKSLQVEAGQICVAHVDGVCELDGQLLLGFEQQVEDPEEVFAEAEAAEAAGAFGEAAALFARCVTIDPGDSVAAFNRGNCLRMAGEVAEAERELQRAVLLDPGFVEAWFNLAGLASACGRASAARSYLERALAVDPNYADAVFNLASVEFDAGDLVAARRWWQRYLELDSGSEWARTAERGLRFAALQTSGTAG